MSLPEKIRKCGLSFKREAILSALIALPFVSFVTVDLCLGWQLLYCGYAIGGAVVCLFAFLTRYDGIIRKRTSEKEEEFVRIFTYFGIYIGNGYNVYQALNEIVRFASPSMADDLNDLLLGIDGDKSVAPYVAFGSNFTDVSIREVMLSVYQMVDEGEGSLYVSQFENLFSRLSEAKHRLANERRKDLLGTLTILPLIGSGIVMVFLTICLVQLMGSYYSVL